VTVAQYRAYLNSFGGADIPSVAAFRERALDGLRKAGCRRSEGGHDSGEAPRRAAGLPISRSQLNDGNARSPVLPEASSLGPLSAQLRRTLRNPQGPLHVYAVTTWRFPVGASSTWRPLQWEATGAVMG
jgi:hypothetical protein